MDRKELNKNAYDTNQCKAYNFSWNQSTLSPMKFLVKSKIMNKNLIKIDEETNKSLIKEMKNTNYGNIKLWRIKN